MRSRYRFTVREIMGEYAVIPMGESALALSGMILTNAVGACLWTALQNETTEQELVQTLLQEFEVDEQTAQTDVNDFLQQLRSLNFLIE